LSLEHSSESRQEFFFILLQTARAFGLGQDQLFWGLPAP